MDRPVGLDPKRKVTAPFGRRDEMQARTTRVDRPLVDLSESGPDLSAPAPARPPVVAPPPPRQRPLFGSSISQPDGTTKLGQRAAEASLDAASGILHAPPIAGGWSSVPAFAVVLADGSVVGRLPGGARPEADGSLTVPAPHPSRTYEADAGGGRRASPFPEGVVVDRAARVAYAPPSLAERLAGSPEPRARSDDGGLLLFLPEGARFAEDGSYTFPAAGAAPAAGGPVPAATPPEPVAPGDPAHGAAVLETSYLGCDEILYEDGWASLRLPKASRVEGDLVLLPPESRLAPGAPPPLLEVRKRADGWLAVSVPPGWFPEGELNWIAPAAIAAPAPAGSSGRLHGRVRRAGGAHHLPGHRGLALRERLGPARPPPGASVTGTRLRVPREYAHAANARTLAAFDREPDGSLVADLAPGAEVLGTVVLVPPAQAQAATPGPSTPTPPSPPAPPAQAQAPAPAPSEAIAPTKTKSVDRFRAKRSDSGPGTTGDGAEIRRESAPAAAVDGPSAEPATEPKAQEKPAPAPEPVKSEATAGDAPASDAPSSGAPASDAPGSGGDDDASEDDGVEPADGTIKPARSKRRKK